MKIADYEQMMAHLMRQGYNKGGYVRLKNGGRTGFAKAGFVFGNQKFNVSIPNLTPVQSKSFQKGLKDLEKWLKNPNAENWIKTFRTPSAKGQTHQSDFSLNLRNYIQGKPVKARTKELFDSVNIKNLLGDTVKDIQTYTPQEFRRVTNLPKSEKAAKVALDKSMKAASAVRDVFVGDPDADLEDVARGIFGKDFDKASVVVQEDMLSKASDDTAKFLEAITANRKVKGFKPISADKLQDIIGNIEDNTKDFKFREGTIREYRFRIRDSLLGIKTESAEGFRNLRNVVGGTDKGKVVDEVFGLSATFKNAPGYVENVQLIDKKINNIKGKQIDKPFSAIVNAVKNKKDIVQYEGKETNISEAIKKFNAKSKAFSNKNKISTPQIFVGDNLDATKLVSNFNQYSPQAQKDILKNAKEGFVLNATKPSTPVSTLGKAVRGSGPTLGANIGLLKGVGETIKAIPTPTGAVALNLAFQPDLSSGIDRAALGAEAAFAPELVRQTSRISSAPIVQRFFNLGLSPQLAARAARVVSPLGLATLAGEGVYQLGRLGAEQRRRMQEMTPEQRRLFDVEQQSISEFAAAGGGIAKLAGKESGPPPEKGPDSEGLASLLKNVKKR